MTAANTKIAVHFGLVLFVLLMWLTLDPAVTLFLGGLAGLLTYGLLAVLECLSSEDLISPLSYHFVWNVIALGIAGIYFAGVVGNTGSLAFDTIPYVGAHDLAAGYLLSLAASFLMHATLRLTKPRRHEPNQVKKIMHPALALLIFALGGVVIMAPRGIPVLSGLVPSLLRQSPLAVLMAIAFGSRNRRFYWFKILSGTAFLVAANMLAFFPYKGGVLQSLFPVIVAVWKQSRKMAVGVAVLIPVFYLAIVAPFVTASRMQEKVDPVERVSDLNTDNQGGKFDTFMLRVFEPIESGFIYGETRFRGYLWGGSMKHLEYAIVPRLLWPDKPDMDSGKWFTEYLGHPDMESSTAMTGAGEMYWNFALPGLVFGMIVVAMCYSFLWRLAERLGTASFFGALLYVLAVINSSTSGDASGALLMVVSVSVVFCPVLLWPRIKRAKYWLTHPPMSAVDHT